MKAPILLKLVVLGILMAAPSSRALAQQPDSATRQELERKTREELRLRASTRAVAVEAPTLFVVAPAGSPDSSAVSTTGCAVAAASGIQCLHLARGGQIVDRRYAAVSEVPYYLVSGYVLAAPGIRPSLVRGTVSRGALEDSARAFLRAYRALPHGR